MKSIYSLTRSWTKQDYDDVVDLAVGCCRYFLLVTRNPVDSQESNIFQTLQPFMSSTSKVSKWPGTDLLGQDTAQLLKYELDDQSSAILKSCTCGLWDWTSPLPEDLSFVRSDGSPWFASITHETDAFFKITDDERTYIEARLGAGSLRFDCVDELPNEIY